MGFCDANVNTLQNFLPDMVVRGPNVLDTMFLFLTCFILYCIVAVVPLIFS